MQKPQLTWLFLHDWHNNNDQDCKPTPQDCKDQNNHNLVLVPILQAIMKTFKSKLMLVMPLVLILTNMKTSVDHHHQHIERTTIATWSSRPKQHLNHVPDAKYPCHPLCLMHLTMLTVSQIVKDMAGSFRKVETDSYSSLCPDHYKCLCNRPPSPENKYAFLHNFIKNSNGFLQMQCLTFEWTSGLNMISYAMQKSMQAKIVPLKQNIFSTHKTKNI